MSYRSEAIRGGKSGQCRISHHLTGGSGIKPEEKVSQKITVRQLADKGENVW